jgi:hypothetical protein
MIEELDYAVYSDIVDNDEILLLLYRVYRSKIDYMELHFKYSPDNEGFIQAKEDFVKNLLEQKHGK